jgi:CNT family concentrative nucleoside transporter
MVPPQGGATGGRIELRSEASSSMDAVTRGTLEGAQLLVNIIAMLVVFVALVALVNRVIAPYTLQGMLGWALAPLAWLAGIPWSEAPAAGALCGFANFGSLGIMIGGLGTMIPEPRAEVVGLGLKSIVAGTFAICLTAATVALLL